MIVDWAHEGSGNVLSEIFSWRFGEVCIYYGCRDDAVRAVSKQLCERTKVSGINEVLSRKEKEMVIGL